MISSDKRRVRVGRRRRASREIAIEENLHRKGAKDAKLKSKKATESARPRFAFALFAPFVVNRFVFSLAVLRSFDDEQGTIARMGSSRFDIAAPRCVPAAVRRAMHYSQAGRSSALPPSNSWRREQLGDAESQRVRVAGAAEPHEKLPSKRTFTAKARRTRS